MNFVIDLNTVLLALIGGLLSIVAWFLQRSYNTLVENQKELFSRQNKAEGRLSRLEAACEIRHGGSKGC